MNKPSSTQQDLARRLFFHSADDDYICARIAIRHALYRHFSWNAGQCLEKYTKCLCLLRGQSAKFDHKFLDHLQRFVIDADPSFFPNQLDVSAYIKVKDDFAKYAKEPLLDCLKRFQEIGNTNVRYRVSQNLVRPYDLQKLDLIVFLLRRLCVLPPQTEEAASIHEEKLRADHFYTTAKNGQQLWSFQKLGDKKLKR